MEKFKTFLGRFWRFFSEAYFWLQSLVFFSLAFLHFEDGRQFWLFSAAALACQGWAQLLEILRSRA